ncbi:hypothetical protein [Teredinibacter sp. KSP-S5-2]|uniref:hypothetical protein n=1 Tax=Teredinibacter sp. KSP-S5-2 TaxID=3034506 RepID=UPI0029344A1A|nr:hypothetical protein [Teredinibacter sp. KSP-S5-2]WNO10978.1 hypothetical protein P5V12_07285 [Teredinibacter sp. KSP-S5-2]
MFLRLAFIVSAFSLFLSGCAPSPVQISHDTVLDSIDFKPVDVVVLTDPEINITTPMKALMESGTLGIHTIFYADKLGSAADGLKLENPSELVARKLRTELIDLSGMNILPMPDSLEFYDEVPASQNYTLAVGMVSNQLAYRPMAWTTYQYSTAFRGELIAPNGEVLWRQTCGVASLGADKNLQIKFTKVKDKDTQRMNEIYTHVAGICAEDLANKFGQQ